MTKRRWTPQDAPGEQADEGASAMDDAGPVRRRRFDPGELRIDTYSHGVPGYNAFYRQTITHVPTGLQVSGSGLSGVKLRRLLLSRLALLVRENEPDPAA